LWQGSFFDPYLLRGKQRDRAFAILTRNPQANLIIPKQLVGRNAGNYFDLENRLPAQFFYKKQL